MESCTCHQACPSLWLANHFGPTVAHTDNGPIPCQMQGDSLQWAHSFEQYFVPSAIQPKQRPSHCAVALPVLQSKIAGKGLCVQLLFPARHSKAMVAHQRPRWLLPSRNVCKCLVMGKTMLDTQKYTFVFCCFFQFGFLFFGKTLCFKKNLPTKITLVLPKT